MTEVELHEFIQKNYGTENERCEWKPYSNLKNMISGHEKEDIASYVAALSNANGGELLIGVEDGSLKIIGIKEFHGLTSENTKSKLLDACTELPSEGLTIDEYKADDSGKIIWIIHVPKHLPRRCVYAHRKAFVRVGDSLVDMPNDRKEAILSETLQPEDWSAQIVEAADIDDLDADAIEKAKKEYIVRNPKYIDDIKHWDAITFLNKAGLLLKGKITRTALILVGKEEASALLTPSVAKIRWCLKTSNGKDKDYDIFSPPFILAVDRLFAKVRNIKYQMIRPKSLFPDEMMRYDSFTIREPLHNCIAHQDYTKCSRIEVTEYEDDCIIFRNAGTFLPESIENVVMSDCPESFYRNRFLVDAMRNLNMIETQGGGIKKLFEKQIRRFFPMPDYDLSNNYVKVKVSGNVLDEEFAEILARNSDLSIRDIMILDKVQKRLQLSDNEIKWLKRKKYIEGRKPNYYLSSQLVKQTSDNGLQAEYIHNRSFDDEHFKQMIIDYLREFGPVEKNALDKLITPKLSDLLNIDAKQNKVRNLLQSLRREGIIIPSKAGWILKQD